MKALSYQPEMGLVINLDINLYALKRYMKMDKQEHRLGVSEVNLVVRHLKLEPVEGEKINLAVSEIDQIYGLDGVSYDEKTHMLNLAYDASRVGIDCVENVLKNHQVEVSHDWWTHLKEGYYRFVDDNVKENEKHVPLSCHKNPPGNLKK